MESLSKSTSAACAPPSRSMSAACAPPLQAAGLPLQIQWRDGQFSDWTCVLADREYRLHKVVLAAGSRKSSFFAAAFHERYDASRTDLTELLPETCYPHIETAFDYMYGAEVVMTCSNLMPLLKIADILQIDALLDLARKGLQGLRADTYVPLLSQALSLRCPMDVVESLAASAPLSMLLSSLSTVPSSPEMPRLLAISAEAAKRMETAAERAASLEQFLQKPVPNVNKFLRGRGITISFQSHYQTIQLPHKLLPSDGETQCCRVQMHSWGHAIIGMSSTASPVHFHECGCGGFAAHRDTFGFDLSHCQMWSRGTQAGTMSRSTSASFLSGKVLQMELDVKRGRLVLTCEPEEEELGSISAPFSEYGELVFTFSSCCSHVECTVLLPP